MFKNGLLLLTFLLLQFNTYAVGSEGNINSISSHLTKERKGILRKFQAKLLLKKINKLVAKIDTIECDTVVLRNGQQLMAYVLEIHNKQIYYKNCDESVTNIDSLSCIEVERIHLLNGTQYTCSYRNRKNHSEKAKFGVANDSKVLSSVHELSKIDNEKCDLMVLNNGHEVLTEVIEISNTRVLYNLCDHPDSEPDSLSCDFIDVIYLRDGTQYRCANRSLNSSKAVFTKSSSREMLTLNCDILVMMNKDQLDVDILEVKNEKLFFKNCGDETAAVDSVAMKDIRTYRQKNGFSQRITPYLSDQNARNRSDTALILRVLLFSALTVIGLFLLLIIAAWLSF